MEPLLCETSLMQGEMLGKVSHVESLNNSMWVHVGSSHTEISLSTPTCDNPCDSDS